MLSYQQYLSRHSTKLSGLARAEKQRRYQDYVRSQRNTSGQNGRARTTRGRRRQRLTANPFQASTSAVARYLKLFASPFTADTVGLPVFPSPPSAKVTSWIRGTFYTGTQGCGYVYGLPTAANDSAGWTYTLATTGSTYFISSGNTTSVAAQNLPFPVAQFTEATGIRQRCVCAAIRVRYVGKDQDLGGVVYPFIHPTHGDINNYSQTSMAGFEESYKSIPVSRDWITLVWSPVHRAELDYVHVVTTPNHANPELLGVAHMGILVAATPGLNFEFEIVQHHEFLGVGAAMSKTENGVLYSAESMINKLQNASLNIRDSAPRRDFRGTLGNVTSTLARIALQEAAGAFVGRAGNLLRARGGLAPGIREDL
jgi:hypothetical protein